MTAPIRRPPSDLPHLAIEERGALAIVRLDRAAKRNAVNDALIQSLERFFEAPPAEAKAVVLAGAGEHFCAGLDLSEHEHRDAFGVMRHSQMWHRVFEKIQFGTLPVVTAMQGGVIGGGLELAARRMCGSPTRPRSTPCPRASAASSSAAARRCGSAASSAPDVSSR